MEQVKINMKQLVPPKKEVNVYCSLHPGKELELYCETCGEHKYDLGTSMTWWGIPSRDTKQRLQHP